MSSPLWHDSSTVIYTMFPFSMYRYLVLLRLQLPLRLLVVLRRVNTMLIVVHKVKPGDCAEKESRVAALSRSNSLDVGAQLALAVQGLSGLDLVDHFAHIHLNLASVLRSTVESHCKSFALAQSISPLIRSQFVVDVRAERW